MRIVLHATARFFGEIWNDAMLAVMLVAPLLMGLVFRFGMPTLESFLCNKFGTAQILTPYYLLMDLLLAFMTPLMFLFAGMMVMLGDIDSGIAKAMAVTPLGKSGYLASRLGIPFVLSYFYGVAVLATFNLTGLSFFVNLLCTLAGSLNSIAVALMVTSTARNKVEGMALAKLSGLLLLGLPAAFLVTGPALYLTGFTPSLWAALLAQNQDWRYALPMLALSLVMIFTFYNRFERKLLG